MTRHPWILEHAHGVLQPLARRFQPRIQALLDEAGVGYDRLSYLQLAQGAAPEPLGPELLAARVPYANPAHDAAGLAGAAAAGFLEAGPGGYRLTDAGRALTGAVLDAILEGSARPASPGSERLERLAALLARPIDAAAAADAHDAPALRVSRRFDPGPDAPVLARIRRRLVDLLSFRDDAHVAAWRPLGEPGHVWEAFSHALGEHVFGERADTPEALAEKLGGFRGYDADAYRAALRATARRGWLEETADGAFRATDEGRRVRESVEEETDRLYFAPWNLTDAEAAELRGLLEELAAALAAEAEPEAAPAAG